MNISKDIKIGVVTSTYARAHDDCQVPWMRELLCKLGMDAGAIRVMAPAYRGLGSHEIDGTPVHRFRYAPSSWETLTHDEGAPSKSRSIFYKMLAVPYLLCGALAVFWWCLRHQIQVLHIHWPFPHALWAVLPKYLLGVKVVAMSHGAELAIARRSRIVKIVLGYLLRMADVRCANSSHTAREVSEVSGMDDVVITPYGATVKSKKQSMSLDGDPMLLFCGRLIQRKGIDVLLRSLPRVLARQKVQVVITGEGDCKQQWMELADELGLSESVRFAGFVSNEELGDLYNRCSAYVHPAIFDDHGDTEGLGVVLIEALSYKKPVIASGVGGIVDVIKHEETGLLVEEKNPEQLAAAINRVLDDSDLACSLGSQGYDHVRNFFDWDRIAQQTADIYTSLTEETIAQSAGPSLIK
ncbi:MAG: glycosyltransferase family 4 protein [Verrucomicrobiae bacterium]|nr:glycosyltransferase family 4 protein [Verrucomicrobiae bacterium]NNJ43594.1 glycosyltransferase family 4 protein [Akkermansiaceae bacterium]